MSEDKDPIAEWADVLGTTIGGGVLAALVWFGLKEPCNELGAGLTVECVRVFGLEYSMGQTLFFVPLIAAALGFAIHFIRNTG